MKDEHDPGTIDFVKRGPGRPRVNDVAPLSASERVRRHRQKVSRLDVGIRPDVASRLDKIVQRRGITKRELLEELIAGAPMPRAR